jgi:hypothetical protein
MSDGPDEADAAARPDPELLERYWTALSEAIPEFTAERAGEKPRILEHARTLNSARDLEDFIALPVAERSRVFREAERAATAAAIARRDAELADLYRERESIELISPAPCEAFVADAKERGGRRGYAHWRKVVAQAAFGNWDLIFITLLSESDPDDVSVYPDRELEDLTPGLSAERRAHVCRRLAREMWTTNKPRLLHLDRVSYVDALKRFDAETSDRDARLHRRCRRCRESRRIAVNGPDGITYTACESYDPHEHWDCLTCNGRGTVAVCREGETTAPLNGERVPCRHYVHTGRPVEPSGDHRASQAFHDRLEALFPGPERATTRKDLYRSLLLILDDKTKHAHVWLCWWADDVAEELGTPESAREPIRTDRFMDDWPDGCDVAARVVVKQLLAGASLPRTWMQASDMIERERRGQSSVAAPERSAPAVVPPWERMAVSDDGERVTLDGVEYRLNGGAAGPFLRALITAKGALVAAKTLEAVAPRPDRVHKSLPPPVKALVEKPGRGHTGYRLVDAPLTNDGRSTP